MLISYIFSTLLRNVEDFMCRMYDVVAFFAIGTVNVQAGVSEVGWQLPVSRGFRVALKWAHVCHLKLTVSMEEGGML